LCYDAVNRQTPDGRPANMGYQHGVTDPAAIIPALIRACALTKDPVLQKGLEKAWDWVLRDAPRNGEGIVYHMDDTREFWVDSLYMLPPALISGGYAGEAVLQADGYIGALWDPRKKLFRHIWDDQKQEFRVDAYWGVGNGWAISGLSRLIESLPDSQAPARERYISVVSQTVEAALACRDGNLFHNLLDRPDSFLEVNFAQMLCYTIAKGVRQGWLPERLLPEAEQIRQTVHKHVTPYGFVTDVCGAPHFNSPGIAPEAQAFFILMESAF
ncbi:MAG: glycoside hydrolase family 88 protein, partial [Oscillospiraceae bacterium]|nr:glycoside hydrolase family 88 protein [Oscillospiraceae bacterium]